MEDLIGIFLLAGFAIYLISLLVVYIILPLILVIVAALAIAGVFIGGKVAVTNYVNAFHKVVIEGNRR